MRQRPRFVRLSAFLAALSLWSLAALAAEGPGVPGQTPAAAGYRQLGPESLARALQQKDFFFVNVHVPYEGEIAGTNAFVPFDRIEEQSHLFPANKDAPIVLYCMSGRMSGIAAETLVSSGYMNVAHLEGGMIRWVREGYPLAEAPGGPQRGARP